MSFRKRNVGITGSSKPGDVSQAPTKQRAPLSGTRPSPIDGRSTTSTGTASLDSLLAGHSGLVLGSSLLIEESGTTDYAGALLRFYAAEGLLQGHHVHVIALPEHWGRELPGLVRESDKKEKSADSSEKMKIAWRYESLGQFGSGSGSGSGAREQPQSNSTSELDPGDAGEQRVSTTFCHTFDLTKKLVHPAEARLQFLSLNMNPKQSPFAPVLERLSTSIAASPADIVHRIVIPSILSPALYPPHASNPQFVLRFFHSLQAILSTYPSRVTAITSLPLSLFPRSSGLVRWVELLNDGVFELSPFPHSADADAQSAHGPGGTTEEPPQGLLQVHKLPMLQERGSGNSTSESDWTFTLSRRKFTIKPFNLPPVEGDTEAQNATTSESKGKKSDLEF